MELPRRIKHLLNARDVRCEGGNDHASRCIADDGAEGLPNHLLARRISGCLCACAVRDERKDSLRAETGKDRKVGRLPVRWRLVKLKVARVHHGADWRVDRIAHRIRDGVANTERLDHERPDLDLIARVEWTQRIRRDLVLLQLVR